MTGVILHAPKSVGRWVNAPPDYGPNKTFYNSDVRLAEKGVRAALFEALVQSGGPPTQEHIDLSGLKAHRSAAGGKGRDKNQEIGRSRGGRTIHALTDGQCRPLAFMHTAATSLIAQLARRCSNLCLDEKSCTFTAP